MSGWVALLLVPAVRAQFLEGVYGEPRGKAAFKCGDIAQQLEDCRTTGAGSTHDQKVCDILRWEQTLCWSRYVAPDALAAVRSCYQGRQGAARAACDPLVEQLRLQVSHVRALPLPSIPALASCPRYLVLLSFLSIFDSSLLTHSFNCFFFFFFSVEFAVTDTDASRTLDCFCNQVSQSKCKALLQCFNQAGSDPAECLKDPVHAQLVADIGALYAQSKLQAASRS